MTIPEIGSIIQIDSVKHDQQLHRSWKENTVLYRDQHLIIGANNNTEVEEGTGEKWRTTEPAIFYFDSRYWFNIIKIYSERPFYYCNLSSPFIYENNVIQYVDYDIDIIVEMDWTYKIVDLDEYEYNKRRFHYPKDTQQAIGKHLFILENWIKKKKEPFNPLFMNDWLEKYLAENGNH